CWAAREGCDATVTSERVERVLAPNRGRAKGHSLQTGARRVGLTIGGAMKARAPGKVVLSGAYAVLEGAPCIVTAVDRYVTADSQRVATHVADEVAAAMEAPFPWVDVSQLRGNGRKLGLGSSAAIVVASLAARHPEWLANPAGREQLYERALLAHRTAQGGGSGVDVAAAVFGGSLNYMYDPKRVGAAVAVNLPDVVLEIWSCPDAASTRGF